MLKKQDTFDLISSS